MQNNKVLISKNITLNYKILTLRFRNLTLSLLILILSFINIINTSALSYQNKTGVSFTFEPTLSINVSSDLMINNLIPGSSSDSNIVNIEVATNTAYGYTLSTNVNDENLVYNNGNSNNNVFSSVGNNASFNDLADFNTNANVNTWGYSYKNNIVATPAWSSYSGLSAETNKTLLDTNTNNTETGTDSVDFKIVAKASSAQPSGTYTGTINFTAVAKPRPKVITDLEYMQDFAELDDFNLASVKSSMPMHSIFVLKDKRDEREYTIAKLADGKIWMTKNLNLAGGTEIASELSDVSEGYVLPTANGFLEGNRLPESSQSGFNIDNVAYLYNNGSCTDSSCFGYYSWATATVGSGTGLHTDNADAPYSICPKGWYLPNSRTSTAGNSDYYQLAVAYGMNKNDTWQRIASFYNNAGPGTISNFLLAGYHADGGIRHNGGRGYCWSATSSYYDGGARALLFNSTSVNSNDAVGRMTGLPIRCTIKK